MRNQSKHNALVTGGLAAMAVAALLSGCARTVTIYQDTYVNNAMHHARAKGQRTGEPLELTIVCVRPKDLSKKENALLKPDAGLTSQQWYEHRPTAKRTAGEFDIDSSQIYLLTSTRTDGVGQVIGNALNGAAIDGQTKVARPNIHFEAGELHNDNAVIYVIGKFVDANGNVLPVPATVFHPPGKYTSQLYVKIGVDEARYNAENAWGQYIRNITIPGVNGGVMKE